MMGSGQNWLLDEEIELQYRRAAEWEFNPKHITVLSYYFPNFRIIRIANFRIESNEFRMNYNLTPPLIQIEFLNPRF